MSVKVIGGLVLAFGCGISLGVGIAAVGGDDQETEKLAAIDWASAINPAENPVYAVPVRVRHQSTESGIDGAAKRATAAPDKPVTQVEQNKVMQGSGPASEVTNPDTADLFATRRLERAPMNGPQIQTAAGPAENGANLSTGGPANTREHVADGSSADATDQSDIAASASNDVLLPAQATEHPPETGAIEIDVTQPDTVEIDVTQPDAVDATPIEIEDAVDAAAAPDRHVEATSQTDAAATAGPQSDREPGDLVIAALPPQTPPMWIRNAARTQVPTGAPVIAIIIDDMGIDQKRSRLAIGLSAPLTLSFIPYGYHLRDLTTTARAAGHEILVHMPMEPLDPEANPGPNALLTKLDRAEILRRMRWGLDRFDGYVGINNHMGSKFSAWRPGMQLVMNELRTRGLLFIDSWTSNQSVGQSLSKELQVPSASRDIFIDHDISRVAIKHSLAELEHIARQRGYAVGIGHPHDLTLRMLKPWIAGARQRGIEFVPISAIVRRGMKSG